MSCRIAVVDDEKTVCQRLKIVLDGVGYVTETFQAAGPFWERMMRFPFQIVFLDLSLPDANGMDILCHLRARFAEAEVIIIACRLMELTDMRLQSIHVEEVHKDGYPPGSGWVSSTWERGLLETAQDEISQLINADKIGCRRPDTPIMRIGDREDELLKEVEANPYDLLVEGVLNSFDGQLDHLRCE